MVKKSPAMRARNGKLRKFSSTLSLGESNIVILGDGRVGKSSIIRRFLEETFIEDYEPTISDVFLKRANLKDINNVPTDYSLRLFDTAGSIAFPAVNRITISQGCAFIIVYSIDSESSFETAARLFNEIYEIKNHKKFPCILVGNKKDLASGERQVTFERALQLAVTWRAAFLEISAKKDICLDEILEVLIRKTELDEFYEVNTPESCRRYSSSVPLSVNMSDRRRKISDSPCKVM